MDGGFLTKKRVFRALKGVSLSIWPGKTVGIVGESGSGKSTLARAMLGLTRATAGEIAFDGLVLTQVRDKTLKHLHSHAAMVFQDPCNALSPRMTVGETLAKVLRTQGETPRDRIPVPINALMEMLGL